jgi:SRSO17 transposase
MPSILKHEQAIALLQQATLSPQQVADCSQHLQVFLQRYLPLFQRAEQRHNATVVLHGKLSDLQRKTSEPIAYQAGLQRKPLQAFVGWAPWEDEAVMAELRRHVRQAWADPDAVFVLDGSAFPKKGNASCGVARQWCGRLGKVDNCQVGIFLSYSCRYGHTGLDRKLFLPKDWADDPLRRAACHVPNGLVYQEHWQIAVALIARCQDVPHAWIATDSEFGRVVAFRDALNNSGERYVVEVRADTLVRDLEARRPRRRRRFGRRREVPWRRVDAWAARQPAARWQRLVIRAGEKGPLEVEVLSTRVQAWADGRRRRRPTERLTVIRTVEEQPRTWYTLSNAAEGVPVAQLARVHAARHRCEEVFEEGKGEVGLGQYEVRRWDGWHHPMTLSLLALWYVSLERSRLRGEKGRGEQLPSAADLRASAASASAERGADRCGDQLCTAA